MKALLITLILLIAPFHRSQEASLSIDIETIVVIDQPVQRDSIATRTITNDVDVLYYEFQVQVNDFIAKCKKQGIELKVLETFRDSVRQDSLLATGKSTLKGGRSKHQYCLAIDVVPLVNGKMQWHNKKLWNKIGKIGQSCGMRWGGNWRKIYDPGHFEYNCSLDQWIVQNKNSKIVVGLREI